MKQRKNISAESAIQITLEFSIPNEIARQNRSRACATAPDILPEMCVCDGAPIDRDVSQNGLKLTWAHRKSAIAALPEKSAIASVECFDPLRRELLDLLDQLSLRQSSWERGDNVNVIGNTATCARSALISRQIVPR